GHFHIPHGLSNALMLGPVLRFNMKAASALYAELGDVLLGRQAGDEAVRAAGFADAIARLCRDTGAPMRLRDVGISQESLPLLAADAMKQTRLLVNNPVEVTLADALALYREAF
ncbi:MAG: iron-containing alcohol dehydrogenase, partial [Rhizobiaceae bacterium]|nr:iron-containing alcohol dehydrogenase [Rhizobiaceae bacterium]